MRIVLLHGYNANPGMNFHPWLKTELEKLGHEVVQPTLLLSDEPNPIECIKQLEEEVGVVNPETIVLGHSLGGVVALRWLEAAEALGTPRSVILVGAPWRVRSPKIRSFFMTEFDFDTVMWKSQEFTVVHDKQDSAVPFDHAEKYTKVLGAELIATEGNGHYMDEKYPILLETIIKKTEPLPGIAPGKSLEDEYQGFWG